MTGLPRLTGRDLTGAARTLPDDLGGTPSLLLVGFAEDQQAEIDLWLEVLAHVDVPKVEVPIASTGQRRFSRFIEGGMVPGVPRERHALTIVVYTDRAALIAALDLPGPVAAAVALDAAGRVLAVCPGAPSADTASAVAGALQATPGGP